MNADATQAPLPLPVFFAVVGVVALLIVVGLLIEGELRLRRLRRRFEFERHADEVLGIVAPHRSVDEPVPYWPVEQPGRAS